MSKRVSKFPKAPFVNELSPDVPEGWAMATLGDICHINPGKPSRHELPDDAAVSFVPMPAVDAELGAITTQDVRPAGEVRRGFTAFRDGDVIVAKITPSMENGKAAVAHSMSNGHGFGSTEFHVLRPRGGVVPEYVLHFVRQRSFRAEAAMNMTGTAGQKRVPADFLRDATVPVAPVVEQSRIAEKLDSVSRHTQHVRSRLQQMPALLDRAWEAVLDSAFATLVDSPQRGRDVFSFITSGSRGWAKYYSEAGELFLRVGNFDRRTVALDLSKVQRVRPPTGQETIRTRVQPGDVLVTVTADIGMVAVVSNDLPTAFVNQHVAIMRPRPGINGRFVAWYLASPIGGQRQFLDNQRGITKAGLNLDDLYALSIPMPSLTVQEQVVRRLDAAYKLLQAVRSRVASASDRADRLVDSAAYLAFRGSLVPTQAELARASGEAFEPADALVDRIRQQPFPSKIREKSSEEKTMVKSKDTPRDVLQRAVEAMPHRRFSFDDLRVKMADDYDAIRDALFELLDTPHSGVKQVFDAKTKTIMLERVSK